MVRTDLSLRNESGSWVGTTLCPFVPFVPLVPFVLDVPLVRVVEEDDQEAGSLELLVTYMY